MCDNDELLQHEKKRAARVGGVGGKKTLKPNAPPRARKKPRNRDQLTRRIAIAGSLRVTGKSGRKERERERGGCLSRGGKLARRQPSN